MSWAVRPNEPSGFRGRKELLNHGIGHNLSLICLMTSEDIKHQFIIISDGLCEPVWPSGKALGW